MRMVCTNNLVKKLKKMLDLYTILGLYLGMIKGRK